MEERKQIEEMAKEDQIAEMAAMIHFGKCVCLPSVETAVQMYKSGYRKHVEVAREMQERLKRELRTGNIIMDKSISDIVNRVAEEILTEED